MSGRVKYTHRDDLPTPLWRLLRLMEEEVSSFREMYRMIDVFEWVIKWHTILALSYSRRDGELSLEVRHKLSLCMLLPSLGLWLQAYKLIRRGLETRTAQSEVAQMGEALPSWLGPELQELEQRHKLINFRNKIAHGATVTEERARLEVERMRPALHDLLSLPGVCELELISRDERGWVSWRGPMTVPMSDELLITERAQRDSLRTLSLSPHLSHSRDLSDRESQPLHNSVDLESFAVIINQAGVRSILSLSPLARVGVAPEPHPLSSLGISSRSRAEEPEPKDLADVCYIYDALRNDALEELNYAFASHLKDKGVRRDHFLELLPLLVWRDRGATHRSLMRGRLEGLRAHYYGRRALIDELIEEIYTWTEPQLALIAGSGLGKSALVAQLDHKLSYRAGEDTRRDYNEETSSAASSAASKIQCVTYCISSGEESSDVDVFLRYLCLELDTLFTLRRRPPEGSTAHLSEQLRGRLEMLEREDGASSTQPRLVLLIDGLDELFARGDDDRAQELLKYVPKSTDWLHIIYSTQPHPLVNTWLTQRGVSRQIELGPLSRGDVRGLIARSSDRLQFRLSEDRLDELMRRSEGVPLFIEAYLREERTRQGGTLRRLDMIPHSLRDHFTELIDVLTCRGEDLAVIKLLALLVIARTPVTHSMAEHLLDLNSASARRVFKVVKRICRNADVEGGVTLYHESVREMVGELFSSDVEKLEEGIAEKVSSWRPRRRYRGEIHPGDRYLLGYGLEHVSDEFLHAQLIGALNNPDYRAAQLEHLDRSRLIRVTSDCVHILASRSTASRSLITLARCSVDLYTFTRDHRVRLIEGIRLNQESAQPLGELLNELGLLDEWRQIMVLLSLMWSEALRELRCDHKRDEREVNDLSEKSEEREEREESEESEEREESEANDQGEERMRRLLSEMVERASLSPSILGINTSCELLGARLKKRCERLWPSLDFSPIINLLSPTEKLRKRAISDACLIEIERRAREGSALTNAELNREVGEAEKLKSSWSTSQKLAQLTLGAYARSMLREADELADRVAYLPYRVNLAQALAAFEVGYLDDDWVDDDWVDDQAKDQAADRALNHLLSAINFAARSTPLDDRGLLYLRLGELSLKHDDREAAHLCLSQAIEVTAERYFPHQRGYIYQRAGRLLIELDTQAHFSADVRAWTAQSVDAAEQPASDRLIIGHEQIIETMKRELSKDPPPGPYRDALHLIMRNSLDAARQVIMTIDDETDQKYAYKYLLVALLERSPQSAYELLTELRISEQRSTLSDLICAIKAGAKRVDEVARSFPWSIGHEDLCLSQVYALILALVSASRVAEARAIISACPELKLNPLIFP